MSDIRTGIAPAWEETSLEARLDDCITMLAIYGMVTHTENIRIRARFVKKMDKERQAGGAVHVRRKK